MFALQEEEQGAHLFCLQLILDVIRRFHRHTKHWIHRYTTARHHEAESMSQPVDSRRESKGGAGPVVGAVGGSFMPAASQPDASEVLPGLATRAVMSLRLLAWRSRSLRPSFACCSRRNHQGQRDVDDAGFVVPVHRTLCHHHRVLGQR